MFAAITPVLVSVPSIIEQLFGTKRFADLSASVQALLRLTADELVPAALGNANLTFHLQVIGGCAERARLLPIRELLFTDFGARRSIRRLNALFLL